MSQFLKRVSSPEKTAYVHGSFEEKGDIIYSKVFFKDLTISTSIFQLEGYPAGFSFIEADTSILLSDFIVQFNALKPIFRSILNDKIPHLVQMLYRTSKRREVGELSFCRRGDIYNVLFPFWLDTTKVDFQTLVIRNSLKLTNSLLEMLIALQTTDLAFFDLSNVRSSYMDFYDLDFLKYAYKELPEDIED